MVNVANTNQHVQTIRVHDDVLTTVYSIVASLCHEPLNLLHFWLQATLQKNPRLNSKNENERLLSWPNIYHLEKNQKFSYKNTTKKNWAGTPDTLSDLLSRKK